MKETAAPATEPPKASTMLGWALVAILVIVIVAVGVNSGSGEKASQPADLDSSLARKAYAQEVQDDMRTKGFGRVTVAATGIHERLLEFGIPGCDHSMLDTMVAVPKTATLLKRLGFNQVKCAGERGAYIDNFNW